MKTRQDRIHIWPISAVFLRALGAGDIDPIMGKYPLEIFFDRVFPSFRDSYILEADYGGALLEYFMCFLLTPLVSVGSHVP